MHLRLRALTFDCHDAPALAEFWAHALGWVREDVRGEVAVVAAATEPWDVQLLFLPVPEHKTAKNRMHPDLHTDDLEREVARLVALGATEVARHRDVSVWAVMNDPEGNEFCVVQPPPPEEPEDEE
jgi:predicted enzyme related to lactoylglutathione lyase